MRRGLRSLAGPDVTEYTFKLVPHHAARQVEVRGQVQALGFSADSLANLMAWL